VSIGLDRKLRKRFKDTVGNVSTAQQYVLGVLVVGVVATLPLAIAETNMMSTVIFVMMFITMGHAWNIVGGYAGQISLGHSVMFAAGAYTTAVLFVKYSITPLIGIPVSALVAGVVGTLMGLMTFHLRYNYFALVTLGTALATRLFLLRWDFVGAATGLSYPFERLGDFYWLMFQGNVPYYYMFAALAVLTTLFMIQLNRSKLGVYLKAIKMDQELAESAGIQTYRYKLYALAMSSGLVGLVGALFVQYSLYIDPKMVSRLERSFDFILPAVIGGLGTVYGPIVGTLIYIPAREFTRSSLSGSQTGLGWMVFGALLMVLMIYRPNGLIKMGDEE